MTGAITLHYGFAVEFRIWRRKKREKNLFILLLPCFSSIPMGVTTFSIHILTSQFGEEQDALDKACSCLMIWEFVLIKTGSSINIAANQRNRSKYDLLASAFHFRSMLFGWFLFLYLIEFSFHKAYRSDLHSRFAFISFQLHRFFLCYA